jgi:hypothetical protein
MRTISIASLSLLGCVALGTTLGLDACATSNEATVGYQNDDASPEAADDSGLDALVEVGGFGDAISEAGTMGGCSGDLRNVVNGNGQVVQACPPDKGCLNGQCIAACDAAGGSHGDLGCDFLLATPAFHTPYDPPCFAAFVTNDWPEDVAITVTRDGVAYDVTQFGRMPNGGSDAAAWPPVPATGIPPGHVAVLFLSDQGSFACPVPPAIQGSTAVYTGQANASGRGKAFHVQTSYPATTYDILPYGGATSFLPGAELVMPTTAWGTNFVAVVPERGPIINYGPQFIQIVATKGATHVTVLPTSDLPAGPNVNAVLANKQGSITLNAGEFVQWQDTHEASGTIIQSDNPVAVIGGNDYLCLPSKTSPIGGGCDSAHQMIPSVNQLGSEYVIAPFLTRRKDLADESILYRLVGFVDGTTLTFDPPVTGAPSTTSRGQYSDFETTGAFRVTSQDDKHPFFIVQEMPGCPDMNSRPGYQTLPNTCDQCLGDEDFVNVLPPQQFLQSYVFFTDPTYWTTNLALVRVKDAQGFHDVTVDCLGTVTGWKDVGSGGYQVTTAELVRSNVGIGSCTNGVHSAKSDGRFGITVWGEDCASSYGYPAGGNAAVINQVVVPPTPK